MANRLLSEHEIDYIERGVEEDIRADGRTKNDYRHFNITTGTVSHTSGSAEIKLVRILNNIYDIVGYSTCTSVYIYSYFRIVQIL